MELRKLGSTDATFAVQYETLFRKMIHTDEKEKESEREIKRENKFKFQIEQVVKITYSSKFELDLNSHSSFFFPSPFR